MSRRKFEIVLARTAGFCMGVRRAVGMVLKAADAPDCPEPIRTFGPLIHNRQVLQVLESRGIRALGEEERASGTVVVRAHGLPRETQAALSRQARRLVDATCPHVRRVQQLAEEYTRQGYTCIIVGDAGHAEVEGVRSFAGALGHVVSGPDEVDALPPADKVVVVAQTTQDEDTFRRTVQRVRQRYGECVAFETVCRSTGQRQAEVRELAPRVDAMVVVGGLDSANTRRLAEISAATGTPTFHVETERDLDLDRLVQCERVGLTAGASTPSWMICRVMRRLEYAGRRRASRGSYLLWTVVSGLVKANVYAAGGAAALTYACAHLFPALPGRLALCMAVAFLFVLGQQLLNQYGRREVLYLSEPDRADFFMANERALLALGAVSFMSALVLAAPLGWPAFGLVALGSVGGLMYRVKLPRGMNLGLGFTSLEQLPASKETFVALAWAALASVVPQLAGGSARWPCVAAAFTAAFVLTFQRTLAQDLCDVEGDQLVGRETLAGALGPRAAGRLFYGLAALLAATLGGLGGLGGYTSRFGLLMLAAVPYGLGYFRALRRWERPEGMRVELLADGQFYLLALLALGWELATG
jgi:4-hydroxy-3-methylbut-2-enyl diphosphate reductase